MTAERIQRIFNETAYTRVSSTTNELRCAEYLAAQCIKMGKEAHLESFNVAMSNIRKAVLLVDGIKIPCTGYCGVGSGEIEAPLYYMPYDDVSGLAGVKGKIVLLDGGLGCRKYQKLIDYGAVGFITCCGDANFADEDIDDFALDTSVINGNNIVGVNIHIKSGIELVRCKAQTAKIVLEQDAYIGKSHNVVLELPGEIDETIIFTAHYDSTSHSVGAYDNMSGCIGLLCIAEEFIKKAHRRNLRFIWCGSEENGFLGSKAYVEAHENELKNMVININLDMIGSIMGNFIACCVSEEQLAHYVQYYAAIEGFSIDAYQHVYAGDSTSFADKGVPALTFFRGAPRSIHTIHNRYDTVRNISEQQMLEDIAFVKKFATVLCDAKCFPVRRDIPEKMKEEINIKLRRK